jgi:alanine-glyoxylate transaminase/serine-glyoxylate transaminase/serine-pyruvate transaminase
MEELAKPATPHYGDEWVRRYGETEDMLRRLFQVRASGVYPVAGPGHLGLETLAFTLLRRGDRVAVIDNGFFGARCVDVLKAHHLKIDVVKADWGAPPDLGEVERVVRAGAKCLAVIHNETSTGMTNPLRELAKVATDHGAWVLCDAVSSLGGLPLPCDEWKVDACFAASQKCIASAPGIAPVAVSKRLLDEADPATADGWYANLFTWNKIREEWGEWHPQPTTISSNVFFAFHRALQVLHEEGLENRIRRHELVGRAYREGLAGLGYTFFCKPEDASNTVSSARPPKGIDAPDLIARLKKEHGIFIAGTLGPMRGQGIRIGHLGTQASKAYVEPMLSALAGYSKRAGVKHVEDAVDRALQLAAKAG